MPVSNFPNGFAQGVSIRGIPLLNEYDGNSNVYWVDSGRGSNAYNGTFNQPFATLQFAVNQCIANNGDIIFLAPGHVETLSAAGSIDISKAGVSVVGLGNGADRPTFTFSATASTMLVTAASVTIQNIITIPSIDSVVSPIVVSAADVWLDFEHRDASSTVEAVRAVLTTAAANNFVCKLVYKGDIGGNAVVNAIRLVGADNADIYVDFYGVASTAVVEFVTTACTNVQVTGYFYNSGTSDLSKDVVDTVGGSTWSVDAFDGVAQTAFAGGSGVAPYRAGGTSALQQSVAKTDGAVLSGTDDLFVITGGPINVLSITGIVTTQIGAGTTNVKLQITTVAPAATVDMNAGAVDIDADAVGTSYRSINTTSIFTPVTAGFVMKGNAFATNDTQFLCPVGTIKLNSDAARAGVIAWYISYIPLSPASRVAAAA